MPGGRSRGLRRLARCRRCTRTARALGADVLDDGGETSRPASRLALERHADAPGSSCSPPTCRTSPPSDVRELIAHARAAGARGGARTARPMRSPRRPPTAFRPSYGPGSAARHGRHAPATGRASSATSTRPATSGSRSHAPGDAARRRCRRGALRARSARVRAGRGRDDRRQRGRRPRALGPAHLAPISTRCSTRCRAASDPGAGLGRRRRHARGDGSGGRARRARLVHPRRPRHRPAPRAHASACAPASRSRPITADLARRYGLGAARSCRRPTTGCARASGRRTPASSTFQEWLVGRRAADPVRAVRFDGAPGRRARAGRPRRPSQAPT